jgi:dTDP-glucose 4,6-dehydratase
MIPLMIINALNARRLPIYGDGLNIRDWLFVEDHCRALKLVVEKGEIGCSYNIGGGTQHTNKSVVRVLCDIIDAQFKEDVGLASRFASCPAATGGSCKELISYVEDRPGHDRRYAIDGEFIERTLGFAPAQTFESGLKLVVAWYIDNEDWWRPVLNCASAQSLPVT